MITDWCCHIHFIALYNFTGCAFSCYGCKIYRSKDQNWFLNQTLNMFSSAAELYILTQRSTEIFFVLELVKDLLFLFLPESLKHIHGCWCLFKISVVISSISSQHYKVPGPKSYPCFLLVPVWVSHRGDISSVNPTITTTPPLTTLTTAGISSAPCDHEHDKVSSAVV